jgi:hypothetical protein
MRNLITVVKVLPGVDRAVDALIARLSYAGELNELIANTQSGRGLLFSTSYYDPWLMGNDLDLRWLELRTEPVAAGVLEISLAEQTWAKAHQALAQKHQWHEQDWLAWHLWQAFNAYRSWNANARMFFGREILGPSLDDDEVSDGKRTNRSN